MKKIFTLCLCLVALFAIASCQKEEQLIVYTEAGFAPFEYISGNEIVGVDVEIMLSKKSDIPLTPDASHYVGNNLMKRGAKVYLFEGGFHHTKIMMVDSLYCTIGSSNLDSRSLRCDYEVNAVIFNKETTMELIDMFEEDKKCSETMKKGYWRSRSPWKQFVGWFGNLLTPVL